MKNTQLKRDKIYFLVLFAALALDLAGRVSTDKISTSDLASVETESTDKACAKLLIDGFQSSAQASCQFETKDVLTKAFVKKATRAKTVAATDSLSWAQPTAASKEIEPPTEPSYADCTAKIGKKNPTKQQITTCNGKNEEVRKDYRARLSAYEKAKEAKLERVFEISVQTELKEPGDLGDASYSIDLVMNEKSTPLEIASAIGQKFELHKKELLKKKEEAAAKAKRDALVKKDVEKCLRNEEGKALTSEERLDCDVNKMSAMDTKEARAHFNSNIRNSLRQMLESGDDADRAKALAISEGLALDTSLPKDVRQVSRVLNVAGKYNDKIMKVSADLAKVPANSPSRAFHLQRLAGLNNQMQLEMGSIMNSAAMSSVRGEALDEVFQWAATLNGSVISALTNPNSLSNTSLLGGRTQLGQDLHVADRWARGISGDPLVNRQGEFSGLYNSTNRFIENQIQDIRRSTLGFTPGSTSSGAASFVPATIGAQPTALPANNTIGQPRYQSRGRDGAAAASIPAAGSHVAN